MLKDTMKKSLMTLLLALPFTSVADDAKVIDGVIYESNGKEMRRFGVNYNTPFAFGYRTHKRLGIDHKQAIDMDVDHIARLGLDAYRVHVWDREISDRQGNLLDNHHLELFDYLLLKLSEKGIKSIITPMAWWGNGYPEPDQINDGFAQDYSKAEMNENPEAVAKTINYIQQLLQHKNRYTGVAIGQDPNIVLFELFNEPKHKSDVEDSREYINRLTASVRDIGVTKPLFYNISEQGDWQEFADAVCRSDIDGIAFQWYPTGLVKMSRLNTNVLQNVSEYHNPFADIENCQSKGKMIYEFDAADVTRSVMYPAMARSFRSEGFQWATQFAYDPGETAHSNSEYNTHYLNLLYTPEKAISLMIAGEAFRQLPRGYDNKPYPQNNQFGDFSIDFHQDLSVLNQQEKFLYSNDNSVVPSKNVRQIAGVGNSKVVQYQGTGAYFLDKLSEGNWRLEVYPDVVKVADPHLPGSAKREVAQLINAKRQMTLKVKDLGKKFYLTQLHALSKLPQQYTKNATIDVTPGVYLLSIKKPNEALTSQVDADFYLPTTVRSEGPSTVWHQAKRSVNFGDDISFNFDAVTPTVMQQAKLYVRYAGHHNFTAFDLDVSKQTELSFTLPKTWKNTGTLEYYLGIKQQDKWSTFPGNASGQPTDWDFAEAAAPWQTQVRPSGTLVELFNPTTDHATLIYPKYGHSSWDFVAGDNGLNQALKLGTQGLQSEFNWLARSSFAEDNSLRNKNLSGYSHLVVKIKAHSKREFVELSLLNKDGLAFGTTFEVGNSWTYKFIELDSLRPTTTMLTKSYPMFLPSELTHEANELGELTELQGFQLRFDATQYGKTKDNNWHGIEVELLGLIKH